MADKPTSPPPAYFLSLSLENVRSFGTKQTISFAQEDGRPAQWTIILGDNGVGKTTVLKSLAAMMRGKSIDESGHWPLLWHYINEVWNPLRNNGYVAAEIKAISTGNKFTVGAEFDEIKNKSSFYLHIKESEQDLYYSNRNVLSIGSVIIRAENKLLDTELLCYGYGAGRATGNSTLSDPPATTNTCASLFDDRADLLNPEEWFLNIDYGSKLAGSANTQLADARDRVEKMLIDVLPGVTEIRIAAAGTPQKPQISLQFLLHGTWLRLRDMSLGYQTLVVWLTDLASKLYIRYPESANPLAEPAIVLIDEIDLHLHPKWQRELLGVLSNIFPETQFIATAHSPLVVLAAGDEQANVVLLRREGDETKVYENPVDVRGWRVDQILTSIFFNLETARSIETEKKMTRQANLLNKEKLSAKERRELDGLTLELEGQPMGSVGGEAEEAEILRELMARLNQAPS